MTSPIPLRERLAAEGFDSGTWSEPTAHTRCIEVDEALVVFRDWLREQANQAEHFAYDVLADAIDKELNR